ncbi:NUDIX domain-containing protein [Mangrovihabitans endophyticus]|uniref:NUDIX domain-containing protein n=1 Tax=Mangrovihabitans endophyticus TaxID=1751298 RepID=UPI001E4605D5|nr:NUDIX hydrolase [Mangrovihabitans endophyticus]
MGERLEPAQWYASLPSFLASASALITNPAGSAVLAVKPNYRAWWNVPGGIMEAGEPPHVCCAREIAEELGLQVTVGRLLVLDWVEPNPVRKAWFGYLFDGGVVADLSLIALQSEELDAVEFVDRSQLRERFTANTADRVEAGLQARASGGVAYLHNGLVIEQASTGVARDRLSARDG